MVWSMERDDGIHPGHMVPSIELPIVQGTLAISGWSTELSGRENMSRQEQRRLKAIVGE